MHRKVPAWFGPGVAGKGPAYGGHLASGLPVFSDLEFLAEGWLRVKANAGSKTPGIDKATVADIENRIGVGVFLDGSGTR